MATCDNHGFIHDDDDDGLYWPDSCYLFDHAKARKKAYEQQKIDVSLIGHTSNPEFEKLKSDSTMEALRDRTIKIDVPFLKEWQDKKEEEERLNAQCYGMGYEHLHVDRDFSLLDKYAIKEGQKILRDAGFEVKDVPLLCDLEEEEPQYQGHPVGTPPPPLEKCTCDLMVLMATGCKCGFIEIERKKRADEN